MKARRELVLTVLTVMCASTSLAQEQGWRPWELSAGLAEYFDNNRDSTKNDTEAQLETRVFGRAAYKQADNRTEFKAYYMPSFRLRSNPRKEEDGLPQDSFDLYHDLGLDVNHSFSPRLVVSAEDSFQITDDPAIMNQDWTIRENLGYMLNRFSVGMNYELVPDRSSLGIHGDHILKSYEDDIVADVADENSFGLGTSLKYLMRSGYSMSGDFSYRQTAAGTTAENVDRDSSVIFGGIGAEKAFGVWSARARAGIDMTSLDNATADKTTKPAMDIDVSYAPTDTTMLSMILQHHTLKGDISPYAVLQRTSAILKGGHAFGPRINASAYALFGKGDYSGETIALNNGVPLVAKVDGTDQVIGLGVSGEYKISRNYSCQAGLGFEQWDSDDYLREDHNRLTGNIGIRADF